MSIATPSADAPLYVVLSLDTDNDLYDPSLTGEGALTRSQLHWRGIEQGIPLIREVLSGLSGVDRPPCVTWFVRVDGQLASIYGDAGYLLDRHAALWRQIMAGGDEIGWHAHLYRFENGSWQQETEDERLAADLTASYSALVSRSLAPVAARIGEAYGSNGTMRGLEALGIAVDSTAMPGRQRRDAERLLDWSTTPQAPYHPSAADYRVPGAVPLRLLEVPMSMIETRAEYDKAPFCRYVDFGYRHEAIRDGLAAFVRHAPLLVTVGHPCTVLSDLTDRRHGLVEFGLENLRVNLQFLIDECRRLGRPVHFLTMAEAARRFDPARQMAT